MIEYFRQILSGQYGASLAMLRECIAACDEKQFEATVAKVSFRVVAYHTLFFTDYYLSPGENAFHLCELHARGGDEREDQVSPGLSKDETLAYAQICHEKVGETLAKETIESLQAPCGFGRRTYSRGELHIYNIRHIQHHTGGLSAHLRRVDPERITHDQLRWIGSGWR
jgi:uncharacterized damage-inducible protein DinB